MIFLFGQVIHEVIPQIQFLKENVGRSFAKKQQPNYVTTVPQIVFYSICRLKGLEGTIYVSTFKYRWESFNYCYNSFQRTSIRPSTCNNWHDKTITNTIIKPEREPMPLQCPVHSHGANIIPYTGKFWCNFIMQSMMLASTYVDMYAHEYKGKCTLSLRIKQCFKANYNQCWCYKCNLLSLY